LRHPERRKATIKRYYAANRERERERLKKWQEENKERYREWRRNYERGNVKELAGVLNWQKRNSEKVRITSCPLRVVA